MGRLRSVTTKSSPTIKCAEKHVKGPHLKKSSKIFVHWVTVPRKTNIVHLRCGFALSAHALFIQMFECIQKYLNINSNN